MNSQDGPAKTSTSTSTSAPSRLDPRVPPQTPSLRAGAYTFNIVNAGHENHSFVIEGPETHLALKEALTRGDTAQIGVTLKAGTYTVHCPVDKHKDKGMSTTITVQ